MDTLSIECCYISICKNRKKEANIEKDKSAKGQSYIWIYQLNIIKYLQWSDNQHEYGFTVNAFWPCLPKCNGFRMLLMLHHIKSTMYLYIYLAHVLCVSCLHHTSFAYPPFNYRKFTMHTHTDIFTSSYCFQLFIIRIQYKMSTVA